MPILETLDIIKVITDIFRTFVDLFRKREKKPDEAGKTRPKQDEVNELVDRFVALFKAHGIERTQIPRFLGDQSHLTLADVSTTDKLLLRLDEPLLSSVCNMFGVQREWLDRGDTSIYFPRSFYKDMNGYIAFLAEITKKYEEVCGFAIKSPEDKLSKNGRRLPITLLFRVRIGMLDDNPIYKFFVGSDEWYWNYGRTRIQLKAMIWAAWQFKVYIGGCVLPQEKINELLIGKAFPGPLVDDLSWVMWHPDDYIFTSDESQVAYSADGDQLIRRIATT